VAPGQPQVPVAPDPAATDAWFRTLQQALQLEAERGFTDLMGRRERFSAFLARSLGQPPTGLRPDGAEQALAGDFARYHQLSASQRQALVRSCRQQLHSWRQRLRPASPPAPPRLRLGNGPASPGQSGPGARFHSDTPLAEIRGVGPRTATRLAQLGLFVVRDLVHYYPRDYLDYANLVRINGLVPGTTATIVATVRRCRSFVSPRNPQLAILELLPFALTAAQERVLAEIRADLARPQPMARLLQGDVGSGKTVVAIAALLTAIEAGCQGALMAPTEVLAEQHHARLDDWLPQLHVRCALLTGSTPARRRRELLEDLVNGQLQLLVGTHALLEDPVQFARLGLVVVDEQHRFGVRQRDRLLHKGLQPHLLTMTATPIPRTLALSLHGDLEVSQIDALPPGRTPIRTRLLGASERQQAYELISAEVALGQRAYVVLPLVEESEKSDLRSAVEVHRQLAQEVFPELKVGLLHGRLASADKQAAIAAFARGDSQVLVSTTVVEVGVDVPEASVMVVEHAERFGLAQLHQLRGRVGRGAAASHCLLIHDGRNPVARQRLEVLVRSSDGFEIAEMDLRLRGPGQVLGTRQSGLPDLALASLADDGEVLERARAVASSILELDPELASLPHLAALLERQRRRLSEPAPLN
jgi:RecG-like helicase